jgi:hypothetical protein
VGGNGDPLVNRPLSQSLYRPEDLSGLCFPSSQKPQVLVEIESLSGPEAREGPSDLKSLEKECRVLPRTPQATDDSGQLARALLAGTWGSPEFPACGHAAPAGADARVTPICMPNSDIGLFALFSFFFFFFFFQYFLCASFRIFFFLPGIHEPVPSSLLCPQLFSRYSCYYDVDGASHSI